MTLRQAAQISEGRVRYLVKAVPQDHSSASSSTPATDVPVYLSNDFFIDRTVPLADWYYKPWVPRIIAPLNITQSVFSPGFTGGLIKPTGGTIQLSNGDGDLDYLLDYSWDKKPVTIFLYRGDSDPTSLSDFFTIFTGVSLGISASLDTIDIVIGDKLERLDQDFPPNTYAGTGGAEGPSTLAGQRKPVTLGKAFNVPAVLINESSNQYQVNDGAVTSIDAVYVKGVTLATSAYTTNVSAGTFALNSTPSGIVTADVTNNITMGSHTNKAGAICYHLLTQFGGLAQTTDVLPSPFSFAQGNPYVLGGFFKDKITILDAVNHFLEGQNLVIPPKGGPLEIELLSFPTTNPTFNDPITDAQILDIEILPTERFSGMDVVVQYKKNNRVLTDSEHDLANSADRDFMSTEWRSIKGAMISTTWGRAYNNFRDMVVNTAIVSSTDATSAAINLVNYHLRDAHVYRVRCKLNPLYLEVGGSVELKSSRFGLTDSNGDGYPMLILSKFDDLQANEVTLELMGETS